MPRGYGAHISGNAFSTWSGVSNTQYNFVDANATARALSGLAIIIQESVKQEYKKRGDAVVYELNRRIKVRRQEQESLYLSFLTSNPEYNDKQQLLAAILPWVVSDRSSQDAYSALNSAKTILQKMEKGIGVSGDWFGFFSQEGELTNGETYSLNSFFYIKLQQNGSNVTGFGKLGTGDDIRINGVIEGNKMKTTVQNLTAGVNSVVESIVSADQVTSNFYGDGANETFLGKAAFLDSQLISRFAALSKTFLTQTLNDKSSFSAASR